MTVLRGNNELCATGLNHRNPWIASGCSCSRRLTFDMPTGLGGVGEHGH